MPQPPDISLPSDAPLAPPASGARRAYGLVLRGLLAAATAAHLLQLFSPLRLNGDAVEFLSLGRSFLETGEFLFKGRPSHYPVGYPLVLAALDRLGIASSFSFVALNLAAVLAGLWFSARILRRTFALPRDTVVLICLMTLMSFVFIKHIMLPISDPLYFGVSAFGLCLIQWSAARRGPARAALLGLALAVAVVSFQLRNVGIALAPAVVWGCLQTGAVRETWRGLRAHHAELAWLALALIAMIYLGDRYILGNLYFHDARELYRQYPLGRMALFKIEDWSELAVNAPLAKLPALAHPAALALGLLVPAAVAWGLWLRRRTLCATDIYVAAYFCVLLLWPYRDARFWLPVIPFVLAYAARCLARLRLRGLWRFAPAPPVLLYLAMGAAAMAYSTWITFSGPAFTARYGDPGMRAAYRQALGLPALDPNAKIDDNNVRIIELYMTAP